MKSRTKGGGQIIKKPVRKARRQSRRGRRLRGENDHWGEKIG